MTKTRRIDVIANRTNDYVCLVPKPDAESIITCHEYSNKICDCDILYMITRIHKLEKALEEICMHSKDSSVHARVALEDEG